MRPGLILAETALATVLIATTTSAQLPVSDVNFDQSGRLVLVSGTLTPPIQAEEDPPTGPPNTMCPC